MPANEQTIVGNSPGDSGADAVASHPPVAPSPPWAWIAWVIFALVIVGSATYAMYFQIQKNRIGPPLEIYGSVPSFALANELGTTVTLESMKGRPWVVDFIFTRCAGQCPLMSQQMLALQGWLNETKNKHVHLLSVTVDPENDSPEQLRDYARRWKADPKFWTFLTGERAPIYSLIMDGFKLGVEENQGKPVTELFVHSNKFALVDPNGAIRGYFVLEEEKEMRRMQAAIRRLNAEFPEAARGGKTVQP